MEKIEIEKRLAQLKASFDPFFEYSDDQSVWRYHHELQSLILKLEQDHASLRATEQDISKGVLQELYAEAADLA